MALLQRKKTTLKDWKKTGKSSSFMYEAYESTYENLLKKSKLPSLTKSMIKNYCSWNIQTYSYTEYKLSSWFNFNKRSKYNLRHQDKAVLPRVRTKSMV